MAFRASFLRKIKKFKQLLYFQNHNTPLMRKIYLFFFPFCLTGLLSQAQNVVFDYDAAGNRIKRRLASPTIDLTPTLPRPIATNFTINQSTEGVLRLTNLKANPTTGVITAFIELGAGFELSVDPAATTSASISVTNAQWTITNMGGGSFQFDSKPGTVIAASGLVNLGYKVKATGAVTTTGIITATIQIQTGGSVPDQGDDNDGNNVAVKILSIIP
jgi:hypothetical protein